jgi:hypothetical protein
MSSGGKVDSLWALAIMGGFYPLLRGVLAVRGTPLMSAALWAVAAWCLWFGMAISPLEALRYLALCLSACAGVAVLGARRPGVTAWNFVVLGLLAALLRPLADGLGTLRLEMPHIVFLSVVLAVGTLNYLPTTNSPAALALGVAWGVELCRLSGVALSPMTEEIGKYALAAAPWFALRMCWLRRREQTEVDGIWLTFRDCYGLVWGVRAREQFNRAAANAGWSVHLGWGGLTAHGEGKAPEPAQVVALLRGVLKRFGRRSAE